MSEFEKKFTQLLLEKDKTAARDHIVSAKAKKTDDGITYPQLEEMTRMAKSRAIVLLEAKTDQVQQEAMAPKFLKMGTDALMDELVRQVQSYKNDGGPAGDEVHKKGQTAAPTPPSDEQEDEQEDEPEGEEEEPEKKDPPPKKKTRKKRGVSARKPSKTDETPPEDENEPQEPAQAQEQPPASVVDPSEIVDLVGERVAALLNKYTSALNEGVLKEMQVNLKSLAKKVENAKDKEERVEQAIKSVQAVRQDMGAIYEQQLYIMFAIDFLGGNLTNMSPEEFRECAKAYMIDQIESKQAGNQEEDAADDGGEKTD